MSPVICHGAALALLTAVLRRRAAATRLAAAQGGPQGLEWLHLPWMTCPCQPGESCSRSRAVTARASTARCRPSSTRSNVRRAGLRPQADRAQPARRPGPGAARRDLRRGDRRGARGRCGGLLRPRRGPGGARGGRQDRKPAHDRRHLPAGHQGAQRGQAVRRRGLRHPADRPRGPRGGRRHHRRGARPASSWWTARRTRPSVEVTDPAKVAWLSQTTLSVDETNADGGRAARAVPAAASTRRATTSATRPRTGRPRSSRSPRESDLVIVVGSRNSSNSVRLVEVALEAGATPPTWSTTPARSTRPGWTA